MGNLKKIPEAEEEGSISLANPYDRIGSIDDGSISLANPYVEKDKERGNTLPKDEFLVNIQKKPSNQYIEFD